MANLTEYEIQRRNQLLAKLRSHQLVQLEAEELKRLLEKERERALDAGDVVAALAAAFLIGAIIALIFGDK